MFKLLGIRFEVLSRDNFKCQDCGAEATHVHHEGYEDYRNFDCMVSLCKYCHEDRHDRDFE